MSVDKWNKKLCRSLVWKGNGKQLLQRYRQENNTEIDLRKEYKIKCSTLKCLKIMSSDRLLLSVAVKCEILPGELDSYNWEMKLVLGYKCGHYLHFLQQHNHVILAWVSLSNFPLAVAAHRQKWMLHCLLREISPLENSTDWKIRIFSTQMTQK